MLRVFLLRSGHVAVSALLAVFYIVGFAAGAVIVGVLTLAGAVRLGWSDVRKRAHGPA